MEYKDFLMQWQESHNIIENFCGYCNLILSRVKGIKKGNFYFN